MTQNQTNDNSSTNIIEQVNEQELQNITGGCIGCAGVAVVSTLNVLNGVAQVRVAAAADREVPGTTVAKIIAHTNLVTKAAPHASTSLVPCEHCSGNVMRFGALKIGGL